MGFIAYVCVTFVVETMSCSNAFLKQQEAEKKRNESNDSLDAEYVTN
jgi:hypothetical protein